MSQSITDSKRTRVFISYKRNVDPDDPLKAFEWRAGGLLHILDRKDGKTVSEQKLSAPPVHEGMIAVKNGIYAALKDGSVIKLSGGLNTKAE